MDRGCGKAAGQGDALAQSGVAFLYLVGRGVPKDYVEGYKWADLAAAQGDEASGKNRDKASRLMTSDQIAEAQRRSFTFVARKQNAISTQSRDVLNDLKPRYAGTGFFITEDGCLLTEF
jgi:TPR repeat protein